MAESSRLVDLVQDRLDGFLADRSRILLAIADDLAAFDLFSRDFLRGGKRFRALFCYWGWQAVHSAPGHTDVPDDRSLPAVVSAAAALEVFHAAALVHDDIVDNSDTRRGAPSAHRRFEGLHRDGGWAGDGDPFGRAGALLLGDLLLGFSDELLDDAGEQIGDRGRARGVRREFTRMRTEVTAGQYLDIRDERAWVADDEDTAVDRAMRVLVYKSAKYSVESPLLIGAELAGADAAQRSVLSRFGLPLGVAFQLRDDLLGIYGDAAVTGKPSGDDLREGKRTVVVALARERMPAGVRRTVDELLGDADLTAEQIGMLQSALRESGAVEEVERRIRAEVTAAMAALDGAPLSPAALEQLRRLASTVTQRVA